MTDFRIVLEKLIDVLQLEGHELFRIFTEVQFALAIQNAIYIVAVILGLGLGAIYGIRFSELIIQKFDIEYCDIGITRTLIITISTCIAFLFSILIADAVTTIYMYANYPEYYAAKELMQEIGNMI